MHNSLLHLQEKKITSGLITTNSDISRPGGIIFPYGGWNLPQLCDDPFLCKSGLMMTGYSQFCQFPWCWEKFSSGIYCLHVLAPIHYNAKDPVEIQRILDIRAASAPMVLVATALLVHYFQTGQDPMEGNYMCCKERDDNGHVVFTWSHGKLGCGVLWDDYPLPLIACNAAISLISENLDDYT